MKVHLLDLLRAAEVLRRLLASMSRDVNSKD